MFYIELKLKLSKLICFKRKDKIYVLLGKKLLIQYEFK